ncbi:MAG: hypothetical protein GKS07_11090 [Nitrosopumilus sp.]|nr:MAG: hypothetical protein GKS07_11090 [Nitrosopumilus sp.]
MNKSILISSVAVVAIIISFSYVLMFYNGDNTSSSSNSLSLSYVDTNKQLQSDLQLLDIKMSSPLKLNGFSIDTYCTFFSDILVQESVEYCTSTELLDSKNQYLGNVQMVGSNAFPHYVIGVIQTDSSVSQLEDVKVVVNSMIELIVCDCWDEKKPGNFESVGLWIDAANSHHLENVSKTSKSTINGLTEKPLLLEITTNENGYLWKFLIAN